MLNKFKLIFTNIHLFLFVLIYIDLFQLITRDDPEFEPGIPHSQSANHRPLDQSSSDLYKILIIQKCFIKRI